jgi:hypothetical protein
MAEFSERQRKILDHVVRSSGEFLKPQPKELTPERKRKMRDHVDRTRG